MDILSETNLKLGSHKNCCRLCVVETKETSAKLQITEEIQEMIFDLNLQVFLFLLLLTILKIGFSSAGSYKTLLKLCVP